METATALVGTGLSAFQAIKSASDKKKAESEAANYETTEIVNNAENLSLSTYGTDIMKEQSARNSALLIEAARGGGARGIASMLPRIQANNNKVDQDIAISLENQDIKRQYAINQGADNAMRMKVQRDTDNLSAISSQYNAANQNMNQGIWGVASGLASVGRGLKTD